MNAVIEKDLAEVRERLDKLQTEMQRAKHGKTTVDTERCANCRFYVDGYCQRFPPLLLAALNGKTQGHWPGVGANDWCGEWRRKP